MFLRFLPNALICVVILAFAWTGMAGVCHAEPQPELVAVAASQTPELDGEVDSAWQTAPAITLDLKEGANLPGGATRITLRAMYTQDSLYLLAQYADPTLSLRRAPWLRQKDGTWKKLKDPYNIGGDNNLYYEDKLAFFWNINSPDFTQTGCTGTCHVGQGKPYGNHYTPNSGEMVDMWHLKSVRTLPLGQVDDQYLDATRYNFRTAPKAGRHSDPSAGGGYRNNKVDVGKGPKYASANPVPGRYWLLADEAVPVDQVRFKSGDEVPGIIISALTGDRADIAARGLWKDGVWTVELARELVTGSKHDVQFADKARAYTFGVAVFDNAQVRHAYHDGAARLVFR